MRSLAEVRLLLDELDGASAASLEAQDLDFKRWEPRSMDDSVRMVVKGKPAPSIAELGDSVSVTFRAAQFASGFWSFVQEETLTGHRFDPDHLLVLHHLLRVPEIDTPTAARLCQRPEDGARELLTAMETTYGYLERGGTGWNTYWSLRADLHRRLGGEGHAERDRRISWEAAKTRILSVLLHRSQHGEPPLTNSEIREIARLDRHQARRLMLQLQREGQARMVGVYRHAVWVKEISLRAYSMRALTEMRIAPRIEWSRPRHRRVPARCDRVPSGRGGRRDGRAA